jgi:hypothetical protein
MKVLWQLLSWFDYKLAKIKPSPTRAERRLRLNTFDIDGVIFLNEDVGGVHPGPYDIIITGRSFEEVPETRAMLRARGIYNRVFFNRTRFVDKTREGSGLHKAETIKRLQKLGYKIGVHFEDDTTQARIIKKHCPDVTIVMLVHDLTPKENVRHRHQAGE